MSVNTSAVSKSLSKTMNKVVNSLKQATGQAPQAPASAYQNYTAPEVATSSMNAPTAAQIAAAKNALGGLGTREYAPISQYTLPAAQYSQPTDQNIAPLRDTFYEQFTQPGAFAAPAPRITAPDAQGTNPILQGVYGSMTMNQFRPFNPVYQPEQSTFQGSRALAGDRVYGILNLAAARGLI